jgi:DNA helicase IV
MHPDLPHEQAYFDRALALRDRQQADLARAPSLSANPKAAVELRKRVSGLGLADPDEAVAFGRIEARNDRWYIGKGAIWGDDNDLVVVNWQAPIAAAFYTATPDEPEGLDARRLYRCTGNQIREIEDLMFREVAQAIVNGRTPEPVLTDALLDSLGSARSGELGDIVATIQAAQYDVISQPLDQLLVVQGGPGTGKTVVGLHRVSWLLFNRRDRLEARDVLIVGPNPAFVRYISSVLPSLGDEAVVQLPLRALGPRVRIGRVDAPDVRRLKGDRRLLRVILRGLRNRQRVEATPVQLTVEGHRLELDGRRIATRARQLAGRPHNEAYRMLRAFMITEVGAALTRIGAGDVPVQGEAAREIDNHLARVWPSLTPQAFLVDLLSSRRQLLAAGAGTLSDVELDMLALPGDAQVSSWQWSADDVPLLDAADALLNGVPATYEHIVVDEAQDLSPLQLESIRRRSRAGSITVLGDLAQGTSPWAHESWDAVVQVLRHERVAAEIVELEYGYRLPAEVHEVAMRLLPEAAPGLACPDALRSSGHEVVAAAADRAGGLVARVVATIRELAGDGIVGVITPASVRADLVRGLDDAGVAWAPELRPSAAPVVVLAPDEAKGLEFDVVVVVEPATIVDESAHGVRSLFVAMTRCTSRLALVHARPLPPVLGLGAGEEAGPPMYAEGDDGAGAEAEGADHHGRLDHLDHLDEMALASDGADLGAGLDLAAVERAAQAAASDPLAATVDPDVSDVDPDVDPGVDTVAMPVIRFDDDDHDDVDIDGDAFAEVDGDAFAEVGGTDTDEGLVADASAHAGAAPDAEGHVAHVAADAAAAPAQPAAEGSDAVTPAASAHMPGTNGAAAPPTGVTGPSPGAPPDPAAEPAVGPPVPVATAITENGAVIPTGRVDRLMVSSSGPDRATVLSALGELDRDIARAVAATVADKLAHLVAPGLLPAVAEELARALDERCAGAGRPAGTSNGHAPAVGDDTGGHALGAAHDGAVGSGQGEAGGTPAP